MKEVFGDQLTRIEDSVTTKFNHMDRKTSCLLERTRWLLAKLDELRTSEGGAEGSDELHRVREALELNLAELKACEKSKRSLTTTVAELETQLSQARSQAVAAPAGTRAKSDAEEEVTRLRHALEALQITHDEDSNNVRELASVAAIATDSQFDLLAGKIGQGHGEYVKFITGLRNELKAKLQLISQHEGNMAEALEQLENAKQQEIDSLKDGKVAAERELADFRVNVDNVSQELQNAIGLLEKQQQSVTRLEQRVAALNVQLRQTTSNRDDLGAAKAMAEEALGAQTITMEQCQARVTQLEETLTTAKNTVVANTKKARKALEQANTSLDQQVAVDAGQEAHIAKLTASADEASSAKNTTQSDVKQIVQRLQQVNQQDQSSGDESFQSTHGQVHGEAVAEAEEEAAAPARAANSGNRGLVKGTGSGGGPGGKPKPADKGKDGRKGEQTVAGEGGGGPGRNQKPAAGGGGRGGGAGAGKGRKKDAVRKGDVGDGGAGAAAGAGEARAKENPKEVTDAQRHAVMNNMGFGDISHDAQTERVRKSLLGKLKITVPDMAKRGRSATPKFEGTLNTTATFTAGMEVDAFLDKVVREGMHANGKMVIDPIPDGNFNLSRLFVWL